MALALFNGPLTNVFQASLPSQVRGDTVILDFEVTIANTLTPPGTGASVEWYLEFVATDPNAAGALWARELAEEDLGTGDVRMALVIRRFAANAVETQLPPGTHRMSSQFRRSHAFYRVQMRVAAGGADTCRAIVSDPFGIQLISAP